MEEDKELLMVTFSHLILLLISFKHFSLSHLNCSFLELLSVHLLFLRIKVQVKSHFPSTHSLPFISVHMVISFVSSSSNCSLSALFFR